MAGPSLQGCCLRWLLFFLLTGTRILICESGKTKPHIVVIMADDFGWSDISYRDETMYTPNIDKMIKEGVHMTSTYMNHVCTPSRAAFLTGIYPYKMGLQHSVFLALANNSMGTQYKILPEQLKEMGYSTHYVGKWHLGFCSVKYTPTNRGFDTFYGMYNGEGDYFTHMSKWKGYDMHNDTGPQFPKDFNIAWDAKGKYSTRVFTDQAVNILENHDKSDPLFLTLAYQAVHGPLQVPDHYVKDQCSGVRNPSRRKHCVMGAAMDEGIGKVIQALKDNDYWDNAIVLFISDNGGALGQGSSNWPLRGGKLTLWEGGTRVVAVLQSKKYLPKAPYEWKGLMHATDWYPTLVSAAGKKKNLENIDGVDNWRMIVEQKPSKRTEFIYNINDVKEDAAIRVENYKLHRGTSKPNKWAFPPAGAKAPKLPRAKGHSEYWLYDLDADPNEEFDLSVEEKEVMERLKAKLEEAETQLVPTTERERIKGGIPNKTGGAWKTGFCDNKE